MKLIRPLAVQADFVDEWPELEQLVKIGRSWSGHLGVVIYVKVAENGSKPISTHSLHYAWGG